MGRLMAIDFGRRRCGIAVTDPLRIVATGLPTVETSKLIEFIKAYVASETVDCIVAGEPRDMRGQPSDAMRYITPVLNKLRKELPEMPVVMWDERFTSVLAHRGMIDSGMKKSDRQRKETADEMAAVIILNSYLESKKYQTQ